MPYDPSSKAFIWGIFFANMGGGGFRNWFQLLNNEAGSAGHHSSIVADDDLSEHAKMQRRGAQQGEGRQGKL